MHKDILNAGQIKLLPLIELFSKDFGLVGGTAIALHIGHRQSIDFDLFTNIEFDNYKIRKKIVSVGKIEQVLRDERDEYTAVVDGVKVTFFYYPFKINFLKKFDKMAKLPDLLALAAMKAYALGRRAKWKDYVDLYFIIKSYHSIAEINKKAKKIFSTEFNEKMFRAQLAYFKDLDYSEKIMYMKGFKVDDKIIKKDLIKFSLR
ncbi:MAG: nucleotidyl transferase AbiEii/AbiGii toxin family protein [Candidatus Pacebacteria bacterium]|nr:nucleotidyl transferase AbiEii/AbiGii toxin family protein [Candidatus Paceibacterota bacterium]